MQSNSDFMKTSVIVLNWNGFDVLKECVASLMRASGDFFVVVADNASSDGSVEKICSWCAKKGIPCSVVNEGEESGAVAGGKDVLVYSMKENYGFAKGNNKAVALAMQSKPERILLLNNDTEVEPDFLERLEEFQHSAPAYQVLTPLIFFAGERNRIWNAGGRLKLGFRKYFYANQARGDIKERLFKPITFVTGCALYVPVSLLYDGGKVLTERFFFGEEDFEFSMRMNRQGVKMACVLDSVIYHKVGASGSRMHAPGKVYLHYLNRFIDIRLHKSWPFYVAWAIVNIPFCLRHFHKATHSLGQSLKLVRHLLADASRKQGVSHDDFDALVINKTYFK